MWNSTFIHAGGGRREEEKIKHVFSSFISFVYLIK
jgi:hypothetical protein